MRLVTFNILHGRSPADGLVDPGRLAAAVAELDPDLLALQEVDCDQPRSQSADLTAVAAQAMGAREHRFVAALAGTPGGTWTAASDEHQPGSAAYGIALLSRYPVQGWHVVRLPALPVPVPVRWREPRRVALTRDEPRVAVSAVVASPAGTCTLTATHLSFVPGWNPVQLRRLLRATASLPAPQLLAGDLNRTAPPPGLRGWRPLATVATFPAQQPTRQLDHVWARGPVRVAGASARELALSDHRALVVELAGFG